MPLPVWKVNPLPIIGMVHLPALPGSPHGLLSLAAIRDHVLRDVEALLKGGLHGLMVENYGDTPFHPGAVPPATIAQMTWLFAEVKRLTAVPCGVNVLRNDGLAALAVASAAGGDFIRVNVLSSARITDQGIIQGQAHELLRERRRIQAEHVQIWADVDVKHSAPLAPRPVEDEVADLIHRAHADAVIVTGRSTGGTTDEVDLERVRNASEGTPAIVGSGVTPATVSRLIGKASAAIVGSALKTDGNPTNPVEVARVRALMAALR